MPQVPPDAAGSLVSGACTASGGSLVRGGVGERRLAGEGYRVGERRLARQRAGHEGRERVERRGGGTGRLPGKDGEQKLRGSVHGGLLAVGDQDTARLPGGLGHRHRRHHNELNVPRVTFRSLWAGSP